MNVDELEIKLTAKNLLTSSDIFQNSFNHDGVKIVFDLQNDDVFVDLYSVEIKQDVYSEEDETKNCSTYQQESYMDCDQKYGSAKLSEQINSSFISLWATYDNSLATSEPTFLDEETKSMNDNLDFEIETTGCKIPCTITKNKTIFSGK